MPPALVASDLRKRYDSTDALRGVSLEVPEGQVVALLGPNGAGKSTLAKIACGLVRPTAGSAEVAGHRAGSDEARARIGYLAELFRLPGLGRRRTSCSGFTSAWRARTAGLGSGPTSWSSSGSQTLRGKRVGKMSKGMQQRLGIAQALVGEPACCSSTSRPARWTRPGGRWCESCWRRFGGAASRCFSPRICCPRSSWSRTRS